MKKYLTIKGARENNLKNIDLENEMIETNIISVLKDKRFSLIFNLSSLDGTFNFMLSKKDKIRKKELKEKFTEIEKEILFWQNCIKLNKEEIKYRLSIIYKKDE